MFTSANKPRSRYIRWLWIPLLLLLLPLLALLPIVLWNIFVLPTATVHYSKDAVQELRYIWNVQERIYKGRTLPGSAVIDHGFLFPDAEFFMESRPLSNRLSATAWNHPLKFRSPLLSIR